jgi:copper chaperone NosL
MPQCIVNRSCLAAAAVVVSCLLLLACSKSQDVTKPAPQVLTRDIVGYFCGMIVEDHSGPKSQILLAGKAQALWFTSVRDGIAFTLLPEESARRSAFYVTAMDKGSWDHPEQHAGAWIDASAAWYVIDSSQSGGMGMPEVIPFSAEKAAQEFIQQHGGELVRYSMIPSSYILGHGQRVGTEIQ